MGEGNLPFPALAVISSPFSSSEDAGHSSFVNASSVPSSAHVHTPSPSDKGLQELSSNIEGLLSLKPGDDFSDVLFDVSGQQVGLHRCILAARCSFFRTLFLKTSAELSSFAPNYAKCREESSRLFIDLLRLLDSFVSGKTCQVGLEAFMLTISFLYSGRLSVSTIRCIDYECSHDACWPAVKFGIEMLHLSFIFDIPELKSLWQHRLSSMLEKAQVDEILPVLVSAKAHGALPVFLHAKDLVAASNIDRVDLEKRLPLPLVEEVIALRCEISSLPQQIEDPNPRIERDCQRIWKALDSDDVELVLLLLNEGRVSLDDACALHYAASYCDPHTVQDLLEVGHADINLRNYRGLTTLHVASMRKEPVILVSLLTKGANPSDVTSDGRTSLQLCTRQISSSDYSRNTKKDGEELSNDRLAVEILDQAGRDNPFANLVFAPIADEKEFLLRLLYLENRVHPQPLLVACKVRFMGRDPKQKEETDTARATISLFMPPGLSISRPW